MKRAIILVAVLCHAAFAAEVAWRPTANPQSAIDNRQSTIVSGVDAITIPQMLSYQGRLTDTLGSPVRDSTYSVNFRLYAAPSGGSAFWNETQSVTTKSGLFSTLLGSVTPIGSMPDAGTLYLGMNVSGGAELSPRLRIVSSAYAYKADTANYALASAGGGEDNAWVRAIPDSVLFTVHRLGIARGEASNMLYGSFRGSHVNLGVACTTGVSGQNYANLTVSGGYGNTVGAAYSTVSGGLANHAIGIGAAVAGGAGNIAGDSAFDTTATVAGGYSNAATGNFATVAGGQYDTASGEYAAVVGGNRNTASGECSFVGGGWNNDATEMYATVCGGYLNRATSWEAAVLGGQSNVAAGPYSVIGGGYFNRTSGSHAMIPGGWRNNARGYTSLAAGMYAMANHAGCFVWGDSLSESAFGDSVYTTGNNQWRVRARGGAWFYSNQAKTTGAYLAPGSNSWESACDSMTKEDFRPVDRKALLGKVAALRVRDYKMKDQNDGTRHIGPVAQDFHNAFGYGGTETGINLADADGVLLAAVQALYEQNQNQQAEIEQLKAELKRR